jgi:hypothetical protein
MRVASYPNLCPSSLAWPGYPYRDGILGGNREPFPSLQTIEAAGTYRHIIARERTTDRPFVWLP